MPGRVRLRASSRPPNRPYDDLDRQIIGLLQKDGRRPNTEIAQQLGVTETTVRKRIGRLVSENLSCCAIRSEEHTSELQSQSNLVCRLLLEKKKKKNKHNVITTTD